MVRCHRRCSTTVLLVVLILAWCGSGRAAGDTRYHQYSRKAKGSGGKVRPVAATFFGGSGVEAFIDVGLMDDGSIVAVGNSWGPKLPSIPGLRILGEERPVERSPYKDPEKKRLDEDHPGMAGFAVRFSPDLRRLLGAVRFGWGSATATQGRVAPDGTVLLSGRCSPQFRAWLQRAGGKCRVLSPPSGAKSGGNDLYLAKLSVKEGGLDWVMILEEAEAPSARWERRVGRAPGVHAEFGAREELVFVAYDRIFAMGSDGGNVRELAPTRGGVLWAVDPRDGVCYVGGDENTNTGREPWRRPFLRKFDRKGNLVWEIWRWDSRLVGTDRYRLVSDSSVRHVVPRPGGDLVVAGWSDGGNSVFLRQPKNLDEPADYKQGFIDSLWGAGVGSFMRLMRLDGTDPKLRNATIWCSFLTSRNKPNSLGIDDLAVFDDDRVAVVGRSASALIESPDAWTDTYLGGTSGAYFAIFSPDLGDLLFSSALPAAEGKLALALSGTRAVIATGVREPGTGVPAAVQSGFQGKPGGDLDGFLLVVDAAAK